MPVAVQAILALFTTVVWPFLKEWLLGMKDHPYNTQRHKTFFNVRSAFVTLLVITIQLAIYTYGQYVQISELKKKADHDKLILATKSSKTMTDTEFRAMSSLKYDLLECTQRVKSEVEQSSLLSRKLDLAVVTRKDLEQRLSDTDKSCKLIIPETTVQEVKVIDNDLKVVRDRIERLKQE